MPANIKKLNLDYVLMPVLLSVLQLTVTSCTCAQAQAQGSLPKSKGTMAQSNAIDPSVIDPVRQLQLISAAVKASRMELSAIAAELEKVNLELDKFEGKPAKDINRKQFAVLGNRFNATLARSETVEKKVSQSLAKSLKDIDNVKATLKRIQAQRLTDKNAKKVLSDSELKECLKDLTDLDKTVRELQNSLKDPGK